MPRAQRARANRAYRTIDITIIKQSMLPVMILELSDQEAQLYLSNKSASLRVLFQSRMFTIV